VQLNLVLSDFVMWPVANHLGECVIIFVSYSQFIAVIYIYIYIYIYKIYKDIIHLFYVI